MKTQLFKLSGQGKERPCSILCQPSSRKDVLHSRSPFNPSKGKSPMKMKKFNSHQLFAEAHKVNGETFLPQPPQSAIFSSKHSTIDAHKMTKKSQLLSEDKSSQPQSKLEIKHVVSINIDKEKQEQDEITKLIQQSPVLKDDHFGNISTVETVPDTQEGLNPGVLKEIDLKKSDTINQILENLKERK